MIKFFRNIRQFKILKKYILILVLTLTSTTIYSQETNFKEYSYTEFFKLIEEEKDSVFILKNAWIKFDSIQDGKLHGIEYENGFWNREKSIKNSRIDTIFIDKELRFENVLFLRNPRSLNPNSLAEAIHHFYFKRKVTFQNCLGRFLQNTFEGEVRIRFNDNLVKAVKDILGATYYLDFNLEQNSFLNGVRIYTSTKNKADFLPVSLYFNNNIVSPSKNFNLPFSALQVGNISNMEIINNKFIGMGDVNINVDPINTLEFTDNAFGNVKTSITLAVTSAPADDLIMARNTFKKPLFLDIKKFEQDATIDWEQFKNGVTTELSYYFFTSNYEGIEKNQDFFKMNRQSYSKSTMEYFFNQYIHENKEAFKWQTKFLGRFYAFYKSQHDTENANLVYMDLKDLETRRLKYLQTKNPSFNNYFKWKVNQFLKVFSNYGTEPSKAVTFSFYVILFFALIYLFFPNSWDSHGKNRIVDRYNFFFTYMKRKAGIHEVYLEDQKEELMSYDQFKNNITSSKQKVPKFFTATALPMYKWAISGTKLSAAFLSKIDIMKGTWSDLPKSKRIWKSILLIGAFLIAVLYDIFIKMLNALMLSINTFTTLGFGEIPIKGLPRYLAIIQGFIGWFMLTIFSVSLISQLLN
jgi:hypothetical protein